MRISLDPRPEPVTITLDCDDGPENERVRWTLRPLTGPELSDARARAGRMPVRGLRVREDLPPHPGPHADADELDDYHERMSAVIRELPDADAASLEAWGDWSTRVDLEVASAALVQVDGEDVPDPRTALQSVRPASIYRSVISELAARAQAVASLDPTARASYGCGSGATPTESAASGHAPTADETHAH